MEAGIVPTPAPSGEGGGRDGAGVVPLNPVAPPTWHESAAASLRAREEKLESLFGDGGEVGVIKTVHK